MDEFKLKPADILVNVNYNTDPWSAVMRWAIGPYSHVFMYLGKMKFELCQYVLRNEVSVWKGLLVEPAPMLFESDGRGVVIRRLSNRFGQEVVVMRLEPEFREGISRIISEAVDLASDPQAYYDYYCCVRFVLPRIIWEKLRLPPDKMPITWQRDAKQICSEAVLEVCLRAGIPVLPIYRVPLPGDFVLDSDILDQAHVGKLSAGWI